MYLLIGLFNFNLNLAGQLIIFECLKLVHALKLTRPRIQVVKHKKMSGLYLLFLGNFEVSLMLRSQIDFRGDLEVHLG